jgi:glucose-6-phosphate dehydrogenase assembly protein OpcA
MAATMTRSAPARHEQAVHRQLMRFGEAESLATPVWQERDTSVRAIAGYLASLWDVDHDDADGPLVREKGLPHARASVLNLIVTVVDTGAADRAVRALLGLGVRHPSRALVVVPDELNVGGGPLDATISTHCNEQVAGGGERVCYEEIVLTVRGEAAEHLNGVVGPLLIHDLPTHVWWPGDPPFGDPVFDQLVAMGDRVLVDSADFADLLGGLRRLTQLRRHCGVGDLSWERLAWWQELTAQFFDAPRFRRYLPNLSRLRIRYAVAPPVSGRHDEDEEVAPGAVSPMAQPLLYAGWIATRLGWRRHETVEPLADGAFALRLEGRHEMVDLDIRPVVTDAVRPGDLLSVRLRSLGETGAAEFIIDRETDSATVATNADGMTALLRRVGMESPREPELLSAQLAMDVVDPVYEDAMRAAAILLASSGEAAIE